MTFEEQIRQLLPPKRWFGDKDREIARVELVDEARVDEREPALVFTIVAVHFTDATVHLYNVPLLVAEDGTRRDALEDVERLRVIGSLMTQGESIEGAAGSFHFGGPGLDPRSPPGQSSIRAVGTEQSNSSLVFDDAVILKLFRRVESGPNPDLELNRLLTNDGFEHIPPHVAEIVYEGAPEGSHIEIDLGIAQQLVKDARDGWDETLASLRALLADASGDQDVEAAIAERMAKNLDDLGKLGDVTASLHVSLAREELEPDVVSEAITDPDVKEWARRVEVALDRALAGVIRGLEEHAEAIQARIARVYAIDDPGRKTRVHGDFHLGQVLLAPKGWMILDLEGEPLRSIEERRAKQSPLKDVAGMLRSFDYAASAALFERAAPDSDAWSALEPYARAWERAARDRFLSEYLRTSHEGGFLPPERSVQSLLLDLFELEKALYELDYERGHRPGWVGIPLRGIAAIAARDGGS